MLKFSRLFIHRFSQRKLITVCLYTIVSNKLIMKTVFSIYRELKVKEVSYETGDNFVTAHCEINIEGKRMATQIQMSHSDLNRIISKIISMGHEFQIEHVNHFDFGNGTEIVDYKFKNVFGANISLQDFQFSKEIRQIRA